MAPSRVTISLSLSLYIYIYSWGQKFTSPFQNLQNVNNFTKIRGIKSRSENFWTDVYIFLILHKYHIYFI